eukprot:NODE_18339_length_897_cov_9.029870.p2 GENE.NODE_18339_length_897_cov_9.029870~~NODE_18339_length_897_cov_9.029870.p2  ORF type:complete len:187 (+),score=38.22 NODE_18339_length_897_cov_9.029870:137-697(+)
MCRCCRSFFFQAEDGIRDFCLSRGLGVEGKKPNGDFSYQINAETKDKIKGEACKGVWVVQLTEGKVAPDGPEFEARFELKKDPDDEEWMGVCKSLTNLSDPGDLDGVLYKAMKGFGTDEKKIYETCEKINSQEMWWDVQDNFKRDHPDFHKGNLLAAVKDELSGGEEKKMKEILEKNGVDWDKPRS